MGDIMITLDKIDLNKKVKVISISDDHLLKRRLLDIGIVKGQKIEKILVSPIKGICAYLVMDAVIAIRDNDAFFIEVAYV